MTVTNEQIQALLEKAESDDLALNGNEISNQLRHLADNEIDSDSFAVVTENYNGLEVEFERPITDLAFDAAEVIDALLAERDADKALIAEQEKRIAELEQRHCGGALMEREQHHVGVVNKLLERIAELEARTLTVKLPEPFYPDGDIDCPLVVELDDVKSACAAAGITLVVGE